MSDQRKYIRNIHLLSVIPFGAIAQLVERLLCKQNVLGSIPCGSTIFHFEISGLLAQLVRASC